MAGHRLRSITVALAFSVGIITVGISTVATSANVSPSTVEGSALGRQQLGLEAATVPAKLDVPSERIRSASGARQQWPFGAAVPVALAAVAIGFLRGVADTRSLAARPRVDIRNAPQRGPPSLSLALS